MNTSIFVALLTAGDMSSGTDLVSNPLDIEFLTQVGVQAVYTGSPVGTFTLEASMDNNTYTTISGSSVSITTSGSLIQNYPNLAYRYIRARYHKTSGTGALTVTFGAKA